MTVAKRKSYTNTILARSLSVRSRVPTLVSSKLSHSSMGALTRSSSQVARNFTY